VTQPDRPSRVRRARIEAADVFRRPHLGTVATRKHHVRCRSPDPLKLHQRARPIVAHGVIFSVVIAADGPVFDFLTFDSYDGCEMSGISLRSRRSRSRSQSPSPGRHRRVVVAIEIAVIATLLTVVAIRPAAAQFNSFRHDPRTILEGNWQSCQEKDGTYTERVYDHVVNGVGQFEVHLGPAHEFAIFRGVQDEHRAHDSVENLLKPYRVPMIDGRARQTWKIPTLGLTFTATLGGGSFTDCDSWYLTLVPGPHPSHE
jgi:hypothetical protein